MDADIRLDGNTTTAEGDIFKTTANDLIIDAPARHTRGGSTMRRALVHDFTDGLTLNWDSDYPGGVTIKGGRLNLHQTDVVIDHPTRRKNATAWRRAFVHDFTDGLTINWAHDYPGGVTINGPLQILGNVHIKGNLTVESRFGTRPIDEVFTAYDVLIDGMAKRIKSLEKHTKIEG